ncbi:ANTAR domain-containing protein [Blastococcus aurantiacus]|uniref:ANTAR domain-containing protein n=1 Tax=Blastococcus aurantiacus TaxID=1550231 RepID=UPI000A52B8C6|nr:ANTAR domain-containing protein [Blastococcus aurantiacus]
MIEPAGLPQEEIAQLRKELEVSAQHVAELEQALSSSRRIGIALGIVMERYKLTANQAFDVLKRLSMERQEKLRAVAEHIADTGTLPDP